MFVRYVDDDDNDYNDNDIDNDDDVRDGVRCLQRRGWVRDDPDHHRGGHLQRPHRLSGRWEENKIFMSDSDSGFQPKEFVHLNIIALLKKSIWSCQVYVSTFYAQFRTDLDVMMS